ncbi:hypothetical protein ACHQM5_028195 [Ranunculus cassubicifolius]
MNRRRDRISYLPDPIRSHILSFLPMKDASRASILSRQWEALTSSLSNLVFDQLDVEIQKFKPAEFRNFVDAVLIRHDGSDIQSFCLKANIDNVFMPFHHFSACVSFAVDHNAKQIELWTSENPRVKEIRRLPRRFFTCKTVTALNLVGLIIEWPLIVKFPALKSFTLHDIAFCKEETINRLISSSTCPVLEDLTILLCYLPPPATISISNSSVKYLKVHDMSDLPIKILITTLRALKCICIRPANLSFENLSTLSSASVDFLENFDFPNVAVDEEFKCATKLVKCLSSVKNLTIKSGVIEFISRGGDLRACLRSPCCSVKYLHLGMYPVKLHVQVIKLLLQTYPNVQTMKISVDDPMEISTFSKTADMEEEWQLKEMSHESILNCLGTVEVINFQGYEAEVEILRYLVESAHFLKNLNIHRRSSFRKPTQVSCGQEEAQITALLSFIARDFPGVSTSVN